MENVSLVANCTCPPINELKGLSWQNVFWSLTALALNAMAQVSTADGNDAEIAFSLWRSSPLICITEIFVMIIWGMVGLFYGNSPRDCLSLSRRYLLSSKKRNFEADGPSNFIALVFFVLLPLPQILKIMASTGLYWTKAWAMAYFLVSVLTFPVIDPGDDVKKRSIPASIEGKLLNTSYILYKLCMAMYLAPWVIVVAWQTFKLMYSLILSWKGLLYLPLAVIMVLYFALILPATLAICGAMLIDVLSRCIYRLRGEHLHSIVWSRRWMEKVTEPSSWNQPVLWGLVWANGHLLAGLFWYSNYYDGSSTTKPSWAEKLG